jgi:uncharacterized protein
MFILMIAATIAPSFDCLRASSFVEKAICESPQLSAKDKALTLLYRRAGRAPEIVQRQRDWVRDRARCQNVNCINAAYDERIADLGEGVILGPKFVSRGNSGTLSLADLGNGWQLFALDAFWSGTSGSGPNTGSAAGTVFLAGNQGVWKDSEGCVLTFKQLGTSWVVKEGSQCTWGMNVTMNGVYRPTR